MLDEGKLLAGGEDAVDAWARSVRPRALIELATRARGRFWTSPWGHAVNVAAPLEPALVTRLAPRNTLAMAALLSLHRSGWVREIALEHLLPSLEPFVVPFLLLRADDTVSSLAQKAEAAIEARLRPPFVEAFVRSLRVVELLRGRKRGSARVRRIHDFLASQRLTTDDPDPLIRRLVFGLRLRNEPAVFVLERALADGDTAVRLWAARTAISRATSDDDKRALLPLLEASRSAWTRALALRARERLDPSDAPLEAALLDPHAVPRQLARSLLKARHPERSPDATRQAALEVLRRETASSRLVGALGALSDVGLSPDLEIVRRFVDHPNVRVRTEARRTAGLL